MDKPEETVKGVAHWSLSPDDNANSDDRINWAEGMLPSAVNDSARMMMTRIREQHDMDQTTPTNPRIAITSSSYDISRLPNNGDAVFAFTFTEKLTEKDHTSYKAGELELLVDLVAPGIAENEIYKKLNYNSIISVNLVFKIGTNTYTHAMQFKLNFFGIEKTNTVISFHELKYFVNNTTLQVGGNNITTNYYALSMEKTYLGSKKLTAEGSQGFTSAREYYYISANECIFIDNVEHKAGVGEVGVIFGLPHGLSSYQANSVCGNVGRIYIEKIEMLPESGSITYNIIQTGIDNTWLIPRYRAVILFRGPTDAFKDYPMVLTPTATNYYPLPV